jgi:hypothetical protein
MAPPKRLLMLVLTMATLAGMGCFRATGLQRSPVAAEVLPAVGGDKVVGLKVKGGSGNLYIGNDFIQVALDDTVYGDPVRTPIAGAASGGSIIDAGYLTLDNSYNRVDTPGNAMNRLTQVVNQDPAQQLVWDQYQPVNSGDQASITMTGGVLDSTGARIQGVTASATFTLSLLDRFITVSTTVTNGTGASLPIQTIGDCLVQQGGGYSFNIPATYDYQGNALPEASQWGVQIPGSDFTNPIATSVQASMVGLMDREPGANTLDSHCSLGILPVDADRLLVAADPQDLLTIDSNLRPVVPFRLVAGSLPQPAGGLAPGASLTYDRRLYIIGGTSIATNIVGGLILPANFPDAANGLFNLMDSARYGDPTIRPSVQDLGFLTFTLSGLSQRQGPVATEVRIERNLTAVTPPAVSPGDVWQVQRVEWFEPNENLTSQTLLAPSTLSVLLPVGIYRMVLTSVDQGQTYRQVRTLFQNLNTVNSISGHNQAGTIGPIWIQKGQTFLVNSQDNLSPVAAAVAGDPNAVGPITGNAYSMHYFTTREAGSPVGNLQPLRMTFLRTDLANQNPVMRRMRTLAMYYDPVTLQPQPGPGPIPGQHQYRAGNEMFGTGFCRFQTSEFAWLANGGTYAAYGQRGPLSQLEALTFSVFEGQSETSHTFTVNPMGLPPSWTSFDVPGPGQATTGGYLPGEKLASAMANGVQVVGHTEQDIQVDAPSLYSDFRAEFGSTLLQPNMIPASLSAINRPAGMPYGQDPFVVGGRTSVLNGYGTATALFTQPATNAPLGGALPSTNWTLADFLVQAQGQYNVVNRPRGPQGLFTLQGAPTQGNAVSPWWTASDALSLDTPNGAFDALELLNAASLASGTPQTWLSEFLQVRSDWFGLLDLQGPTGFTKALGLSSASNSYDTPVGLARTYLKANPTAPLNSAGVPVPDLSGVLSALRSGAAVASTGPFLDVSVGDAGPGQLVPGPVQNVTLAINLWTTPWIPVDEIRVIINGSLYETISPSALTPSGIDSRLSSGTFPLTLPAGQNAWVVVEAGVPLAGPTITPANQALWATWNAIMRNIYPVAVTNPIFVDVMGNGYTTPAL